RNARNSGRARLRCARLDFVIRLVASATSRTPERSSAPDTWRWVPHPRSPPLDPGVARLGEGFLEAQEIAKVPVCWVSRHRGAVLVTWVHAACRDPERTAPLALSRAQFFDHIPQLLDAL